MMTRRSSTRLPPNLCARTAPAFTSFWGVNAGVKGLEAVFTSIALNRRPMALTADPGGQERRLCRRMSAGISPRIELFLGIGNRF